VELPFAVDPREGAVVLPLDAIVELLILGERLLYNWTDIALRAVWELVLQLVGSILVSLDPLVVPLDQIGAHFDNKCGFGVDAHAPSLE